MISKKHCPKCNRRVNPIAFKGEEIEYVISATEKNATKILKFCSSICLVQYDAIMIYLANGSGKYTDSIYKED